MRDEWTRFSTRRRISRDVEVARGEQAVSAARDALAQAKAEAEAVEKHHDRWKDEHRRRAEARAEGEAEDLVSARHGRT